MAIATDALDLSDAVPEDTVSFAVMKAGTSQPTGWVWQLASPGHDKAVAWATANSQQQLQKRARLEAQQANGRKIKPEEKSTDEAKADNVDWIISRTLGWAPAVTLPFFEGPLAYSDDTARKVLMHPKMGWLFVQLVEFLTEEANFTKRSAKN